MMSVACPFTIELVDPITLFSDISDSVHTAVFAIAIPFVTFVILFRLTIELLNHAPAATFIPVIHPLIILSSITEFLIAALIPIVQVFALSPLIQQ